MHFREVEPITDLKRCKSEPSKIQVNGQKYVKFMTHQDHVVVNKREYSIDQSLWKDTSCEEGNYALIERFEVTKEGAKTVNLLLQQLSKTMTRTVCLRIC